MLFPFFLIIVPTACGSFHARDQTRTTAMTHTGEATMPDPQPLDHQGTPKCCFLFRFPGCDGSRLWVCWMKSLPPMLHWIHTCSSVWNLPSSWASFIPLFLMMTGQRKQQKQQDLEIAGNWGKWCSQALPPTFSEMGSSHCYLSKFHLFYVFSWESMTLSALESSKEHLFSVNLVILWTFSRVCIQRS